jgi:DNA polymerase III sliding clamp (beta) subunit (PCNA family)
MTTTTTTTTMTTTTLPTLTLNAQHLRRALRAVVEVAKTSATLGHAWGVRLEADPISREVILIATDGHRLHLAFLTGVVVHEAPFAWTWSSASVVALLKALPARFEGPVVLFRASAAVGGITLAMEAGGEFPAYRQVIPHLPDEGAKADALIGINPDYLADACAACREAEPELPATLASESALDPLVLRAGREPLDVVCVIMPSRV